MSVVRDDPIRVLLVGLSPLVQGMVEAAFEDDFRVEVLDASSASEFARAILQTHADFVIVPLEQSELPDYARRFLADQAHVRVLGLEEDQGHASLYELVPETTELTHVAPDDLAAAIREAVSGRAS
jgi:DNA-binding NarL/FixJ family response regulator